MSVHRHTRSRSHRRPLRYELDAEPFLAWFPPDPDQSLVVAGFGDAASLALEVFDLPVEREAMVLLDERRRVTAILVDPPSSLGVFIGWCDVPGFEVPFCQTLSIVRADHARDDLPDTGSVLRIDQAGYYSLRRIHMLQGLQLLDVILVDHDQVQSLAIACDPDAVWFDPFEPLAA